MINLSDFFQLTPLPTNRIDGHFNLGLVAVSYGMAFFASYIALDFAGRLRLERNQKIKRCWLIGGAFSMGAGIWSMHFIGMLAFIMPMAMGYDYFWTASSLIVAIISAGFALFLVRDETGSIMRIYAGGVALGLGIATMHYMGMTGMTGMHIHYMPGLFFLSIAIAIIASEAALMLCLESNRGPFIKQIRLKILSAFIMGAAICGMHYTGMAAAIFTPSHAHVMIKQIEFFSLSIYVACVTGVILIIALLVSTYKQLIGNAAENEKHFLNAVLNNLSDAVLACDSKGKLRVVNPAFKALINLDEADYLNGKWVERVSFHRLNHQKPIPYSELPISCALRGDVFASTELELHLKNKGNKRKHNVLVSAQPILISGEKLGAVITIFDITLQKKIAQQLEAINQELDAFTYSVAHDLKSPLRAIDGFSKILLDTYSKNMDEECQRILGVICANAKKMRQLIEDLLAFSHMGRHDIKKEKLNMQQLVNEICNELMAATPNRKIVFDIKKLPDIHADRALMHQVWVNLISNAIKFTQTKQEAHIEVGSMADDTNSITYYISDNGLGFDMQYADKLFGIFQRLHGQDIEGTGIGLANVKRVIIRHGGVVGAEGKPDSGAKFYFTLPKE